MLSSNQIIQRKGYRDLDLHSVNSTERSIEKPCVTGLPLNIFLPIEIELPIGGRIANFNKQLGKDNKRPIGSGNSDGAQARIYSTPTQMSFSSNAHSKRAIGHNRLRGPSFSAKTIYPQSVRTQQLSLKPVHNQCISNCSNLNLSTKFFLFESQSAIW